MAININIVSIGARTPIGLQAASSAAAVRAGISGLGKHPFMIDRMGDPMPGALDAQLDCRVMGPERFLALAETAMREACAPLNAVPGESLQLPVYLGLPEIRPGFSKKDAETVQTRLADAEDLPCKISDIKIFTQGHAAGLAAIAAAMEQMLKGTYEACLVGGVETYFQPDTMEWLDVNRQLAGKDARSAFVPGEGAGFCLLMVAPTQKRLGLEAMARVQTVAVEREKNLIKTSDVSLGEGLTEAVRETVRNLAVPDETITDVICDINNERYRGEEWGFVCLRLSKYFDDPSAYNSPANCWGDMGAASGLVFAMLACKANAGGYAKGARTLLWASSEGGLRAAAVLNFDGIGQNTRRNLFHV
jgi:3-oxoacyl-[acyl-carrier-protein] synthase I